jgi:hypothetical protein
MFRDLPALLVSLNRSMGHVGMNIGNAIASIVIANLFDKNNESTGGHPLRPKKRASGNKSNRQRGSNSFAEHPERW